MTKNGAERLCGLAGALPAGPAVIYTVDPATLRPTSVSAGVLRELGYTPEEYLAGEGLWRSILHPEDAPRVFEQLGRLFETGEVRLEYRLRRKDGQWRWTRDDVVLRFDAEGRPLEIVGCAYDAEERKRLEQYREHTENLFEGLFRHHLAIMLILEPETLQVLDANNAALAFYGWTREQALARTLGDVCQDGAACRIDTVEQCRAAGGRVALCRHLAAGGELREVDMRVSRIQAGERCVLFAVISDVTGRMRAEAALRASEARLKSLHENTHAGMFQSTPDGRLLWVNPAFARIFGYDSPGQMVDEVQDVGRDIYHNPEQRQELIRTVTHDGSVGPLEVEGRRRDGSRFWVLGSSWIVRDAAGGIERIEGVVEDITARRQAEMALRESEERLRSICENTREGIFQVNMDRRFIWVNAAYARMLGYASAEELVAAVTDTRAQVWASPEDREKAVALLLKREALERQELRLRRRDGLTVWVAASAWVVRGPDGLPVRYEGVVEDITARKLAESERMLLATAVEQAAEGVAIVTGGTWQVEYANPAFGAITGFVRTQILGQDFFGLFGRGRQPLPARDIQKALLDGQEWTGPVKDLKPCGRPLAAEAIFSPIRDASGHVGKAVVLLRDVSTLTRLENRLRRAQKLEAVGTLAGGIAHDFNNILTPILLNAEVGLQLLDEGDILRRPLEEIVRAGGRARQLIKQILVFSRQGDLRAARIDLAPIVREAVRLLRERLPADVELLLDEGDQPLPVLADPSLVHQVVVNLADNALHAMQEKGGILGVRLRGREAASPGPAGETELPTGWYAVLEVSDTGHGMDAALVERIFTPFFTTKKPGEGTGMGLSTVHGIIRSLGGAVRVESHLGEGSRFEVHLPLAGPDAPGNREEAGRRVLVVDAQAFSRRAMAMILDGLGYKTTSMRDPTKALKVFSRAPARFHAVLAGEDLHGMSGRAFLKACRKMGAGAGFILLTDSEEKGVGSSVADAAVLKPVAAAALAQALGEARACAGRRAGAAGSTA